MKRFLLLLLTFILLFSGLYSQESEILKLKEKIIDLQNDGELGFKEMIICSKIFGFGSYVALRKPIVDKGGELLVYFEPKNVFTNRRDEMYEIWYTEDMALLEEHGEVLQEWKEIVSFHYTAQKPVLDLFGQNSINLGGKVPPGKYRFRSVLKDKLSCKKATKIIDFEIR